MPGGYKYKTYGDFLKERFPWKMQKLSVNVGFTCPNRDGTIARGGCHYCNNKAFVPSYCQASDSVAEQLEKGKRFFGRKYPEMRYMAYFQAYTSTHSPDRERLLNLFRKALEVSLVEALVISTRPDCVDHALLTQLTSLGQRAGKRIMFEIGVESSHDETLRKVNRSHSWSVAADAIRMIGSLGIDVCAHLIMGLPGETNEMMFDTIRRVCALPVTSLKLHQLQIIKDTPFAEIWHEKPDSFNLFSLQDYLAFCHRVIELVPPHIAIERFTASAPPELVLAPKWGIKNYQFVNLL